MPITDSRLKGGTLTLGATSFAKQMTSVALTPSTEEDGEPVETLDGSEISAEEKTTWSLDLGAIQDFDDSAGFIAYTWTNAGDEVAFTWEPNSVDAPSYGGTVKVRPVAVGGDVNARLTTTASFPLVGDPTPTYPA